MKLPLGLKILYIGMLNNDYTEVRQDGNNITLDLYTGEQRLIPTQYRFRITNTGLEYVGGTEDTVAARRIHDSMNTRPI